jgi:cell wall-associated NlpC family hydrolase
MTIKKRGYALILTGALLANLSLESAIANKHKPTLAEIEAAKQAETIKKREAAAAAARLKKALGNLKALSKIANEARGRYQAAMSELAIANTSLKKAEAHYQDAVAAVVTTNAEIGKLAINAYTSGGGLSDLEAVLSANGPQEMIDRISSLENLGVKNKTALQRFKAAELVSKEAKALAEIARTAQARVTEKVAVTKREADDAQAAQQREVDKLQAVQDKLQRELSSAKNVRITLEQQRQLAILEETRANEASKTPGQSKVWKTGGPSGKSTFRSTPEMRAKAVEFAKRQVLAKKPYVWGDEGPNTFDCSGLVYAAYKSAGLGWPIWDRLNSGLYYTYTKQIPLAEMEPGDLIFYSYKGTISTIHHMSIYAGNGMMWEARSTATGLRFSSIYSVPGMMPYAGRV